MTIEDDHSVVRCNTCGWEGQVCDCKHGCTAANRYPIKLCPICGSDNVKPLPEEDGGMHDKVDSPHYPKTPSGGFELKIPETKKELVHAG